MDPNKDICIGVINSVSSEDNKLSLEYKKYFDLIIIDECHRLGAEQFCNVLNIYGQTSFVLGISATPDRQDRKHELYYNFFDHMIDV